MAREPPGVEQVDVLRDGAQSVLGEQMRADGDAALLRFDNLSLVPPDPPVSDGVIILRPLDESDLLTIERAASDAEIPKRFDLHTRSPADYLAAAKRDAKCRERARR